jgi:hypothetical protein
VSLHVLQETIQEVCDENGGVCPPGKLVEKVTPKDHPAHDALDWDDTKMAHDARISQARNLIRSIRVTLHKYERAAPAYVNVKKVMAGGGEIRGYMPTEIALSQEHFRKQVLDEAWRQLRSWQKRYKALSELAGVIEALEEHLPEDET